MSVQSMTEELANDPNPLTGKIVATYMGSPHPTIYAYIDQLYLVSKTSGKKIFVTKPDGTPAAKTFIMPRSVAVHMTADEVPAIEQLIARLKSEREAFITGQSDLVNSLCTAPEATKPKVRQRTRG